MFELSKVQFFCLIFFIQTGGIFISFQHYLIDAARQNSWLFFLAVAFIQYLLFLLFEKTFKGLCIHLFIQRLFKLYWLLVIISGLSFIAYLLTLWILPKTPVIVIVFLLLAVIYYANSGKTAAVLNVWTISLPIIVIVIFLWSLAIPHLDWFRAVPTRDMKGVNIAKGFLVATAPMVGLEFYLFLRPYVKEADSLAGWPLFIYQSVWTAFYLFSILITQLFFSLEEIKLILQPSLYLMKSLNLSFVERGDLFFLVAWIIWSITTVILYIFFLVMIWPPQKETVRRRQMLLVHLLLLCIIGFFVAKERNEWIREIVNYAHLAMGLVLPVLLILLKKGLTKWTKG